MAVSNTAGILVGTLVNAVIGMILLVVLLTIKEDLLTGPNATVEVTGLTLTFVNIFPWLFSLLVFGGLMVALIKMFQDVGGRR